MPPVIYVVIAIITTATLIGAVFLIRYLLQRKYENFVMQNSVSLKQLNEINRQYTFFPNICFDQTYTYDNENFYDTISCEDYLIYQLRYIGKKLFEQINKIKFNNQLYSKYLNDIKISMKVGQYSSSIGKLNPNRLEKIERRLIDKHTYVPTTQFYLTVTLYCSNMNGQVYSQKRQQFSANDIFILNKRLNNKNGDYYNDSNIWNAICRVERGQVSNKMRFAIYERDGHRCCKCGVSGKNARLEIDHIIPISRGGKSTYDNLQTLCHKCNVEKGDSCIKYQ